MVELVVAAGLVVIFAATAVAAMTQMNRYANSARLQTLALAVAQHRVDEILTARWGEGGMPPIAPPIIPSAAPPEPDWTVGEQITLNDDPLNTGTLSGLDIAVPARRQTYVTTGLRSCRAVVRILYVYLDRPYTIELVTFRTIDEA